MRQPGRASVTPALTSAQGLDDDLHQVRRNAGLGVSLEDWAEGSGVPLTYARALRRFIEQG